MALPDFLIIGAMKCATSTLQAQLAAQPGVFMTTPKEPNFFSDDEIYARGLPWYEGLFADAAPGDLKGEASTHYTKLPTYPECLARLSAALERPKLIYMIRNPIDRAISHYIHEWTLGRMPDEIGTAIERHPELIAYSEYAYQIAPYLETYGAERICLTSLERLQADPGGELTRIGTFLDLPAPPVWQEEQARVNASAQRIRRLPLHGLLIRNPVAAALRRALIPQAVRNAIKGRLQMQKRPEISQDCRTRLEEVFAQDYAQLRDMFPGQDHLGLSYPFVRP